MSPFAACKLQARSQGKNCQWHLRRELRSRLVSSWPVATNFSSATDVSFRGKDGVIGRANLWIADDFWVLRFRLMVETRSALSGLMHQKEKRSMDHFAGLDVSVKETSVCIVDETGKIVREVKVTSEPEALLAVLKNPAYHFKRIGLEAGPLSQWLFSAVAEAELPVVCVETRHMQAVLKAQINKTDRNDARGIAARSKAARLLLSSRRRGGAGPVSCRFAPAHSSSQQRACSMGVEQQLIDAPSSVFVDFDRRSMLILRRSTSVTAMSGHRQASRLASISRLR